MAILANILNKKLNHEINTPHWVQVTSVFDISVFDVSLWRPVYNLLESA